MRAGNWVNDISEKLNQTRAEENIKLNNIFFKNWKTAKFLTMELLDYRDHRVFIIIAFCIIIGLCVF